MDAIRGFSVIILENHHDAKAIFVRVLSRLFTHGEVVALHDLNEFFRLSSALNYNLSASSLNRYNVLMFIMGRQRFDGNDDIDRRKKSVMMEALSYLFTAFSQKRRRLGPMAVLHPLRATILLARAKDKLELVDLLTALFHDILEDIRSIDFEASKWKKMEQQLFSLLEKIDPEEEMRLMQRLVCLTKRDSETYYQYIGRLLEGSCGFPELVQVKLADRLDNTLDMRIVLEDPLEGIDFFQQVFELLFVNTYSGYKPDMIHLPTGSISGVKRLYQLFKNAVLLSLIRQYGFQSSSETSSLLFDEVARASLKEAQRNFIHIIGYHFKDVLKQRELLLETMEYCYSGRSDLVTSSDQGHLLDGLFSDYFGSVSKQERNRKLDELYQNKPLMIQASIGFIVIFLNFLNSPTYYVRGISKEGVKPQ